MDSADASGAGGDRIITERERRNIPVRSEDTVFLLDASRSMFKKEQDMGGISRFRLAVKIMKEVILKKKKEDASDRYAVAAFNGRAIAQDEMYFDEKEPLEFVKNEILFDGGSALGNGLAAALRIIIRELRKIGEKTSRIVIISDGIVTESEINPIGAAKVAHELGIIIDAVRMGPAQVPGNVMKRVTEITGGNYYFISSIPELNDVINKVAAKKETAVATIFDKKKEDSISAELLAEIAGTPLKPEDLTEEQYKKIFGKNGDKKIKCSICYSDKCGICDTGFYGCGRFCPNCLTPMHLHCSIAWADQQNKKNHAGASGYKIFRCVHCFYLLKIPIAGLIGGSEEDTGTGNKTVSRLSAETLDDSEVYVCGHPECGVIIDPRSDGEIYKCNNCGTYFHADCFKPYYDEEHKCPNCGRVVKIVDESTVEI